jgi:hypothetical protein
MPELSEVVDAETTFVADGKLRAGLPWSPLFEGAGPHQLLAAQLNRYSSALSPLEMVLHLPVAARDGEEVSVFGLSTVAVTLTTAAGMVGIDMGDRGSGQPTSIVVDVGLRKWKWSAEDGVWWLVGHAVLPQS